MGMTDWEVIPNVNPDNKQDIVSKQNSDFDGLYLVQDINDYDNSYIITDDFVYRYYGFSKNFTGFKSSKPSAMKQYLEEAWNDYYTTKGFAATITKQEVFDQLKTGIGGDEASEYSISTLKELLSDLQPTNYKWLTYSGDGRSWSAEIKGDSWGTNLDTIEPGIAYPTIVEKLSQAIQAAAENDLLVDPYTPEAVEGLILRVSEALSAAAKIPYMLKDLTSTSATDSSIKGFSSGDITINLSNKNAGHQYIVAFQKPTNLNQIYKTLFPTAWKIVPLGNNSSARVDYPVSLQIMVEESVDVYDAMSRATKLPTEVGQMWEFSIDGDFAELKKISGETVDGEMGCINKAPQLVDIALAKKDSPLIVKREVAQDDQAIFQLTPKLYFAYVNDLQEGDLIKSDVSASKLYELDLTNLKSINLELSADPTTRKKKWTASNRKAAS
ncbi:hypothetical protein ACP6PL_22380 [Dapis sp. BLCC M126]|uniref:hypothetical protein n=1 Tax=Dapis sp. BLCC M126 TaxID=3400189 RepID=UPI003CEB5983